MFTNSFEQNEELNQMKNSFMKNFFALVQPFNSVVFEIIFLELYQWLFWLETSFKMKNFEFSDVKGQGEVLDYNRQ